MKKYFRPTLYALLVGLFIIQFFRIDKSNPPTNSSTELLNNIGELGNGEEANLLKDACFDCHSHHSTYPWYTNIQPVGWWVKGHVKNARKKLNFSEWAEYSLKKRLHKLEECVEEINEGKMPLKSYTWAHDKSRLSTAQKDQLMAWFKAISDASE